VFWPLKSFSKFSRVLEDSKLPFSGVWVATSHFLQSGVATHRVYYKGGRWWLPSSPGRDEFCESVFVRGSSVHQKCSSYALTNLLFGLCMSVWVIELLVNLSSPYPKTLVHPFTPEVLRAIKCAPTPSPSIVFTFGLVVSPSRGLGVRHWP
jgi:hypothetical protein